MVLIKINLNKKLQNVNYAWFYTGPKTRSITDACFLLHSFSLLAEKKYSNKSEWKCFWYTIVARMNWFWKLQREMWSLFIISLLLPCWMGDDNLWISWSPSKTSVCVIVLWVFVSVFDILFEMLLKNMHLCFFCILHVLLFFCYVYT